MGQELIISISGLRGIVGQNLDRDIAFQYAMAFGTFLKDRFAGEKIDVCIGRDSRPSGSMIKAAVADGLRAVGIDVVDLGIVTTPCVGIMVRYLGCQGGVVITASHNPVQYNGIKLLLDNGMAPVAKDAARIKACFLDKDFSRADLPDHGRICTDDSTDRVHIAKVLAVIDSDKISAKNFRVVLDSVNGAGGRVTKKLLAELGCEVVAINDEPTGQFSHGPEPTAENLADFCAIVKEQAGDVGFAQDPDADRLAIVDENGSYIGEEYSLALATKYVLGKTAGPVATNLSTSRMVDDVAAGYGCEVIRTPVGEANVAAAMMESNCVVGGEGNGGVIDLRVGPIRDSLVGIAFVLQLMAEAGKTISGLVKDIGGYYMIKDKFAADKVLAERILSGAVKVFSGAKLNSSDGFRFDFEDGWLHLRTSNTEPVMRVIAEAKSRSAAEKYIDAVADIREKVLGE